MSHSKRAQQQFQFDFPTLCECGCGLPAPIAKKTHKKIGHVKGKPVRFIRGHNRAVVPINTSYSVEARFWAKVDKRAPDECWPWTASLDMKGYGQFWDGERRRPAHAYSFELFNGVLLGEFICCHHCDNPICVNPYHLFAGTVADNMRDMRDKGRRYQPDVKGENNGRAKLTRETVEELRRRFAAGESRASLSRAFGVCWTVIDYAVKGQSWK